MLAGIKMSHSSTTALCRAMKLQCELYPRCLLNCSQSFFFYIVLISSEAHPICLPLLGFKAQSNPAVKQEWPATTEWFRRYLDSNWLLWPQFGIWQITLRTQYFCTIPNFFTNLIGDLDVKWGNPFLFPELLALLPNGAARPTLNPMGFNHWSHLTPFLQQQSHNYV